MKKKDRSGRSAIVVVGLASLREGSDDSAALDSHLQFGESVFVRDQIGDWYECEVDFFGYSRTGFIHFSEIGFTDRPPTYKIKVQQAPLLSYAGIMAGVLDQLPRGSEVRVVGESKYHYSIWPRGFVFKHHVEQLTVFTSSYTDNIREFLGMPYIWGGRTALGVDCAGYIELALRFAGYACPRHREDFPKFFGPPLQNKVPKIGDIAVFSKHCTVFASQTTFIYANAFVGLVVEEPINEFLERRGDDIDFVHIRPC